MHSRSSGPGFHRERRVNRAGDASSAYGWEFLSRIFSQSMSNTTSLSGMWWRYWEQPEGQNPDANICCGIQPDRLWRLNWIIAHIRAMLRTGDYGGRWALGFRSAQRSRPVYRVWRVGLSPTWSVNRLFTFILSPWHLYCHWRSQVRCPPHFASLRADGLRRIYAEKLASKILISTALSSMPTAVKPINQVG
jgi:hypothetical protein